MLTPVLALSLAGLGAPDGPFLDLDYAAARERARAEKTLLLVDFTATWCPPCKRMDAETWKDPVVLTWLEHHALAIQVDVDEEPALAAELGIEALPTVVALREGEPFDRVVGFQDPGELLTWGYAVLRGERREEELVARSSELADSEDVDRRYELARELACAGRHAEALEHFLWLWPATRRIPRYAGVRLSFLLGQYAELAEAYPPAREAFLRLLDEAQEKVEGDGVPEFLDWQEWTSLAEHLGEGDRLIPWYEARRDADGRLLADEPPSFQRDLVVDTVLEALVEHERFRDAAVLVRDPAGKARKELEDYRRLSEAVDEDMWELVGGLQVQRLTHQLSVLHGLSLLAGRDDDAGTVGELLLGTVDTPEAREELVRQGIRIGGRRHAAHETWLAQAELAGADVAGLRRRLAELDD